MMRIEKGDGMVERVKNRNPAGTRHVLLTAFFRRQLWPARLFSVIAVCVIALLLGALLIGYASRLYDNWQQTRLLYRATSLLQEGKLIKAEQNDKELLVMSYDFLPSLFILAEMSVYYNINS